MVVESAQTLVIQIKCATTKHLQTIGKLVNLNLEMASGATAVSGINICH